MPPSTPKMSNRSVVCLRRDHRSFAPLQKVSSAKFDNCEQIEINNALADGSSNWPAKLLKEDICTICWKIEWTKEKKMCWRSLERLDSVSRGWERSKYAIFYALIPILHVESSKCITEKAGFDIKECTINEASQSRSICPSSDSILESGAKVRQKSESVASTP